MSTTRIDEFLVSATFLCDSTSYDSYAIDGTNIGNFVSENK